MSASSQFQVADVTAEETSADVLLLAEWSGSLQERVESLETLRGLEKQAKHRIEKENLELRKRLAEVEAMKNDKGKKIKALEVAVTELQAAIGLARPRGSAGGH